MKHLSLPRRWPALLLAGTCALIMSACGGSDPQADVAIVGTGPGQPVAPGTVAEFRMRVSNSGPDTAEDVLVTNTLDGRLTLQGIACEAEGGAQCPGTTAVAMTIGRLPAGGALTFIVRGLVPDSVLGGLVLNQMSTRHVPGDPDLSNNTSTTSAVVANAQLTVSYTGVDTLAAGNDLVFTAGITNLGPASANDVQLDLTDPAGLTALPLTCEAFDGALCPADLSARPLLAPLLPSGGRLRLRVAYATPPALRGDLSGSFAATTPSDPNPDNNRASFTTRLVAPTARLAVAHRVAAVSAAGTSAAFKAVLENRGPVAFALVMTQTLPDGLQATGWRCTASLGATCPATLGPSMSLDVLPADATLTFDYVVALPLSAAGSDVAARFAVSAEGVPVGEDTVGDAITSVRQPQYDLQVRQSVATQVAAGAPLQFTVSVSNLGPDTARGAQLAHRLSGAVLAGSLTYICSADGGATCPALAGPDMVLPDMPVGSSLRLRVDSVAGAVGGSVTAAASVTGMGDTQPGNDSDTDSVTIVPPPARLSASMSAAATAPIGGTAAFTARVTNGGPEMATGVRIDFSSEGLTGSPSVTCTASAGAACPAALGATTRTDTLAAGAWLQLRYELPVPAGATLGSLVTGRVAASADGDPATGDNLAEVSTTLVAAAADLQLTASLSSTWPQGIAKTAVVVLVNRGPSEARGVTLRYSPSVTTVPLTLQCTSAGGAACPTDLADPSTLLISSLPVGAQLRISYAQATASLAVGTVVEDQVTVAYAGDPDPSNDGVTLAGTVTAPPDARNGSYVMVGGDGQERTLALDFDARTMSVAGTVRAFTGPDANGRYDAGQGRQFRITDEFVVGLDDASGSLLPYVAGRRFITDLALLGDGTDVMLANRSVDSGVAASAYFGARWDREFLSICRTNRLWRAAECPVPLAVYRLALQQDASGPTGVISATDVAGVLDPLSFRIARVGDELVLVRRNKSRSLLELGLPAQASTAGTYDMADAGGGWAAATLSSAPAMLDVASTPAYAVTLTGDSAWPTAVLGGVRSTDGAALFVAASPRLLVTVGVRQTPATGFLSIGLAR
ncbi:MAG: hypothetical protein H6933_14770 [Burkholderiaceae bacterium]|nr:hypothetical protein [Rhodoferax sp.]MCP5286150.1 hypothetical protein [Burkholderiaceae bacterium]